ncbi:Asparagine synthase [Frankia sp. Hr75.2]|nr:Asparagine synthase [Frankia sp. Hr75.2]
MLRLHLTPYGPVDWSWSDGVYATAEGASSIRPFAHPMVEDLAVTDGQRTLIVVRERIAGRAPVAGGVRMLDPAEFDTARSAAAAWPADFVMVETAPRMPVRVSAGACGTVPLYLAEDGTALHGSWDMADLQPYARVLSTREAARLLAFRPRYGSETLFEGIRRLTERATAHYGGGLYISYPEPALHRRPRALADGADVLGAFRDAIDTALDLRPLDQDTTAWHLTGGFDSGVIATRAAQRWPNQLTTAALLIGGPGREQQIRRRAQMRTRLPFSAHDTLVDALTEPPLHPGCARLQGEPISPYEEPLHHPFRLLTQALRAQGARVVVTGIGGDEMVAVSREEYPETDPPIDQVGQDLPWLGSAVTDALAYADDAVAPPAVVNSMTLLSMETMAPVLLRAGIWPVHPFAHPGMVQLGEQLPYDWRELKQLQRRQLASLGLNEDVTHPVERESFAEVVQHTLTSYGPGLLADMLTSGSMLFDMGLVDPDRLADACTHLEDHALYDETRDAKLIEVIHLHLATTAFLC